MKFQYRIWSVLIPLIAFSSCEKSVENVDRTSKQGSPGANVQTPGGAEDQTPTTSPPVDTEPEATAEVPETREIPTPVVSEEPAETPLEVSFDIPATYDGEGPINTPATAIQAKVYPGTDKQKIKITNLSAIPFVLHTSGSPCAHGAVNQPITQGQEFTCTVTSELKLDPNEQNAPTYNHLGGSATSLFINAVTAEEDPAAN